MKQIIPGVVKSFDRLEHVSNLKVAHITLLLKKYGERVVVVEKLIPKLSERFNKSETRLFAKQLKLHLLRPYLVMAGLHNQILLNKKILKVPNLFSSKNLMLWWIDKHSSFSLEHFSNINYSSSLGEQAKLFFDAFVFKEEKVVLASLLLKKKRYIYSSKEGSLKFFKKANFYYKK